MPHYIIYNKEEEVEMFNNIGDKIQIWAIVLTVMGMIGSIIYGALYMQVSVTYGLLIMIFGCIGSWISSFLIYGFGEIIIKLNEISKTLADQRKLSVAESLKTKDNNLSKELKQEVVDSTLEERMEEKSTETESLETK